MARRVQCQECVRVYKVGLIDPDTNKETEHLRMCLCAIAGECVIGYDCGKGHCPCYKPIKQGGK